MKLNAAHQIDTEELPPIAPFNVFIDSDGPMANFDLALKQSSLHVNAFKHLPGTYLWLSITPGAEDAMNMLKKLDDQDKLRVWILTKTPKQAPYAYTEKVLWYRQHFPWLEDRVILSQDKHLIGTDKDFLLDDRPHKANADKFRGQLVYFNPNEPMLSWMEFMRIVLSILS